MISNSYSHIFEKGEQFRPSIEAKAQELFQTGKLYQSAKIKLHFYFEFPEYVSLHIGRER